MSIADALLSDFRQEALNTRKILEAVPEDRLEWKPHEKSMTLGQLAGHIAETPGWAFGMMEDELDTASSEQEWKPFVPESAEQCLTKLEECAAGFAQILDGRDDDFMSATWTMRHGDTIHMQAPRHAALRGVALHHWAHHRGQLTVYLRLLDVAIPSTYGPTADDTLGM